MGGEDAESHGKGKATSHGTRFPAGLRLEKHALAISAPYS